MPTAERRKTVAHFAIGFAASLTALSGLGCIKPESAADEFTGRGSSVTGDVEDDDAPSEEQAGGDDEAEDDAEDDDGEPPSGDGDVPIADSGVKSAVDAAQPRADAAKPSTPTPTQTGDASVSSPAADASVAPGGPASDGGIVGGEMVGPAPTKLVVSAKTVTLRGRYSPSHVLAIWVVDAQGKFVKTLAKHAFIRARYLTGWNSASAGNVVDAVTSATLTSHQVRTVTWNLTNVSKQPVPDGEYKVVMELTDADRTGVSHSVMFTKGKAAMKMMAPDAANFTGITLSLE